MRRAIGRIAALTAAALFVPALARADICIGVDLNFPDARSLSRVMVRTLKEEVTAIWLPYGVRVDWGSADGCGTVDGTFDVSFERRPATATVRSGERVLGSTYLQHRIAHAPIHIDFDAVAETVRSLTDERLLVLTGHHGVGSLEIGRALGRVLAHEIGHVLLAAPYHQRHGLMRPSLRPGDLAAMERSTLTLSPGEVTRLRQRERVLVGLAAEAAGCEP
jgi:hypothetical protein